MSNEYGLDYKYFQGKLKLIVRDARNYTPDEMARELARMSKAADSSVILNEDEFNKNGMTTRGQAINENKGLKHQLTILSLSEKHDLDFPEIEVYCSEGYYGLSSIDVCLIDLGSRALARIKELEAEIAKLNKVGGG